MEIPKAWLVQGFVAQQPVGAEFSTVEVLNTIGRVLDCPKNWLDKMKCVEKIHAGSLGGYYQRDPNIFVRSEDPGKVCDDCWYAKSGSSGCVIQDSKMLRNLELKLANASR